MIGAVANFVAGAERSLWIALAIVLGVIAFYEGAHRYTAERHVAGLQAQRDQDQAARAQADASRAIIAAQAERQAREREARLTATQTRILDELQDATLAIETERRRRGMDAASIDGLQRALRAATERAADADRRASTATDTAAEERIRRARERSQLLAAGVGLAAEGARLVDGLRSQLNACRAIAAADREVTTTPDH